MSCDSQIKYKDKKKKTPRKKNKKATQVST